VTQDREKWWTAVTAAFRPRHRGGLLTKYGVIVVVLLLATTAITSVVQLELLRGQSDEVTAQAAPVLLGLLAAGVRDKLGAPPADWQKLVDDFGRLAQVRQVRVQVAAVGDEPEQRYATAGSAAANDALLDLRAHVRDANGALRATVELRFGTRGGAMATRVWTVAGVVAVLASAVFAAVYRLAYREVQPMAHVRDNLLAYHCGAERSLELLSVQGAASAITEAWNGLVAFMGQLQQEVDDGRCRQAVTTSLRLADTRSAQAVLDALPIGIIRVDATQKLVYANAAAIRLLNFSGYTGGAVELARCGGDAALVELLAALQKDRSGAGRDHRREQGGSLTVLRLTPVIVEANVADERSVLVQDVTQLKEAERSRDEFLAHITHELRTPLTNIRAYTETLTEEFFDDEQTRRECYNVIMSETRRLSQLIEDVLSVSQIEAGAVRVDRATLRVEPVLRQVVQEVQAAADARAIELSLRIPTKVPPISGDRHRLHQVWTNLVGNAIKYTPRGGSVSVDVEPSDGVLRVHVSDTGIGIPADCREKVFQKFFRVKDPAVEAEVGSGLGLAIAREIVRLHGGTLQLESELNKGSTFTVELPVAADEAGANWQEASDGSNRDR